MNDCSIEIVKIILESCMTDWISHHDDMYVYNMQNMILRKYGKYISISNITYFVRQHFAWE